MKPRNERIPIPKKTQRKLLVESGNKCSVPLCNESHSLEFHHINSGPSDNRESNLIVFCRNHHAMAERGKIDRKECASYKERLKQIRPEETLKEKVDLEPWKADEEPSNIDIMCKICEHLQESQYAIINITDWNPNVLLELGLAYGLGKTVVLIKDKESGVPVDLKGMEYMEYESSEDLSRRLKKFFLRFK